MLTEKENYLRTLNGEIPEIIMRIDPGMWKVRFTAFDRRGANKGGGFDAFGVEFVTSKEAFGAALPKPGQFILKDIRKWRDIIKTPDLSGFDWESYAKEQLKNWDTSVKPLNISTHNGYFQHLINFMGFTEGLCAIHEEPDEVMELFDYLSDYFCEIERNMIKYYKPLGFHISDDVSTAANPFISPELYRKVVLPYHKRQADMARDNGLYIQMHCCGRCEDFIDDWVQELGACSWDPAQPSNDLVAIKKRYPGRLTICGGWDTTGPLSWTSADDDLMLEDLHNYVDRLAPGGCFIYGGFVMGIFGDADAKRKNEKINKFYEDYVKDWYKVRGFF